jgi:peptidoglycan DL-endopeptidase LytF
MMSMNSGPGMTQYTVQEGDTLWDLANEYDTNIEDIMAVNPGIDPDNLQVGQVIALADPPPTRGNQRGPGRRPEFRPGRRPPYRPYRPYYRPYRPYYPYVPPYAGACPAGARPYTVQPGDNLYSIAARFGISVDTIISLNPYVNFGLALPIGQLICLPY